MGRKDKQITIKLTKHASTKIAQRNISFEDIKQVISKSKLSESDNFDKFLMFYPTVYGTETAETNPTLWPKLFASIPVIGWVFGQNILAAYTYVDRQAGVSIHCRLVDVNTGDIDWIRSFTGQDKIRLEGGRAHEIIFPTK